MAAVWDVRISTGTRGETQIEEEAFMKLECGRDRMLILLENHQDIAYLRNLGPKKNGDKLVFELGFSGDPGEPGNVFLSTEKDYGEETSKEYQDDEI